MSLSLKSMSVITLFTEDLAGTRDFYEEILGLPVLGDHGDNIVFKLGNVMVNLARVSAAASVGAPTGVADPGAGVRVVLPVAVDDVDAACAELARHGVALLDGPVDRSWGVRTVSFADPAGHIWELAQNL
jgi:catechol 2,3-dioxygenase-like lactoylglutathione lyase family enzyme